MKRRHPFGNHAATITPLFLRIRIHGLRSPRFIPRRYLSALKNHLTAYPRHDVIENCDILHCSISRAGISGNFSASSVNPIPSASSGCSRRSSIHFTEDNEGNKETNGSPHALRSLRYLLFKIIFILRALCFRTQSPLWSLPSFIDSELARLPAIVNSMPEARGQLSELDAFLHDMRAEM